MKLGISALSFEFPVARLDLSKETGMKRLILSVLSVALVGAAQTPARAFIYDEAVNGDLSNDRLNPTLLVAGLGANTLTGMTVTSSPLPGGRDFDYLSVTIPTGLLLSSVVLANYSGDDLTFFGMLAGTPFTVPPTDPPETIPPRLLGWVHLRPDLIGSDLLPTMAAQTMPAPVIGFTAPLPAGDYSFWIQETSGNAVNYSFTASVIPEPSTFALFGFGLLAVGALVRRRRA